MESTKRDQWSVTSHVKASSYQSPLMGLAKEDTGVPKPLGLTCQDLPRELVHTSHLKSGNGDQM